MQLRPEQLPANLERNGLAPLYIISGDEPLQTMEAADRIRAAARAQGYDERIVLNVETGFDWSSILQHADSLSLFASRKLIELRMANSKPGKEGARVLADYAGRLPADTTLLVSTAKLDSRTRQGKWYKALEKAGIAIVVWPVEAEATPDTQVSCRYRGRYFRPIR